MPPKVDPYATPAQRRIDLLLLLISAISFAILILAAPHGHATNEINTTPTIEKGSR
jgi:hypothetical protein